MMFRRPTPSTTSPAPDAAAPPCGLVPGDLLHRRYRLEAVLGWGGIAVVFRARDMQQEAGSSSRSPAPTHLAVKVVRSDLAPSVREEAVATLRWESYLLRRMSHPALPRLLRASFPDQRGAPAWIARDMVEGTPLAAWAGGLPCTPEQVRNWAVQLCDLLGYLHTRTPPVICGDIKPSNVILRPDGSLVLIDLGAAQTRTRRPPRRPRPRYGTPGYASTEQLGEGDLDERSDVFSLAVLCYELLTGLDPTDAPLQFDLDYLEDVAPADALALRQALALEATARTPTAAVLRAALAPALPTGPLALGQGLTASSVHDLVLVASRQPHLLERAITSGALDSWLAVQPTHELGQLLHTLRAARRAASARQTPVETFLAALAPAEGSPLLVTTPECIEFGALPLRHWRTWSVPQRLLLQNRAPQPLCWELECPAQRDAVVRILADADGRTVRRTQGVLAPGGRTEVLLVAAGKAGQHQGTITLCCGTYTQQIAWQGTAKAGLTVGGQFAERLEHLDLSRPDLLPALDGLLRQGVLPRWLRAQGKRDLAAELAHLAGQQLLSPLEIRLLVGRLLHHIAPLRFPLLHLTDRVDAPIRVAPGTLFYHTLEVANLGTQPCVITWASQAPWVRVGSQYASMTMRPGARVVCEISVAPPGDLAAGQYDVLLNLQAGSLVVPVTLPVEVPGNAWWQRLWRWIAG